MATSPKLILRFSKNQNSRWFFVEIDKPILKFHTKTQETQGNNNSLGKKKGN
jgi:hypothetical protein